MLRKKEINSGDLVYVPSEVYLYKNKTNGVVSEWTKLKQPINLLVTAVNLKTYEVFYSSEYWLVDKDEVHTV